MATAPTTKKSSPSMRDQDEVVTPEDRVKMQEQLDEQRRAEAEQRSYDAADMMSGEKPPEKKRGGAIKMSKGSSINLKDCKVNTAESKNSKHKHCW